MTDSHDPLPSAPSPADDLHAAVERTVFALRRRRPDLSGHVVLDTRQKFLLLFLLLLLVAGSVLNLLAALILVNALAMIYYLILSLYKFFLIDLALASRKEIEVSPAELAALRDDDLPVYSILVPLYHEAQVLDDLLASLARLDYPHDKLDVLLLLESDDDETRHALAARTLPPFVRRVLVPQMPPRTKPKACNVGLHLARGRFLVIYDAEDRPDPDQLKKAVAAFGRVDPSVVCLQAKLNFYNPRQNLLTRLFTLEYSMWYDLFLPGLDYLSHPVPLGGTSNHFRTDVLRQLLGWDPYNVTEDCDLGVRLAAEGFHTRIIDSTTWEEACSSLRFWVRQRSRWIKGYMQTYLVHSRRPLATARSLGLFGSLGFHLMVGATPICLLINPIYWLLALGWVLFRSESVAGIFPFPVIVAALVSLFAANFVFIYAGLLAACRRRYYDLAPFALLMPFYWVLMSVGAWKGVLQLFRRPSFWEKTRHGLSAPSGLGSPCSTAALGCAPPNGVSETGELR